MLVPTHNSRTRRIIINSLFIAVVYVLAVCTYMVLTAAACWLLGQKAIPTYNEILNLNRDYDYWSKPRVIVAFGSAPILMLLMGVLLLRFSRIRYRVRPMRFFLFWWSIACINFFLTNLVIVPASHISFLWGAFQGFATIAAWFYLPFGAGLAIAVVGLLLAMGFGFFIRQRFFRYYFPVGQEDDFSIAIGRAYFLEMFWLPLALAVVPLLLLTNEYSISLHLCILLVYVCFGIGLSIKKQSHFILDGDADHNVYQHIF